MTSPCETQAPERDSYRETIAALERRLDEVRGEREHFRRYADEASRTEANCRDALDEFGPHHTGLSLPESIALLRTRLSQRVGEIEGIDGWRVRLAAAESERDALAERLAAITKFCGEEVKVDAPWLTPALLAQVKGAFEGVLAHVRALAAPRGDGR